MGQNVLKPNKTGSKPGFYDFSHGDVRHGDVRHATFVTGVTRHRQIWGRSSRGHSSRSISN